MTVCYRSATARWMSSNKRSTPDLRQKLDSVNWKKRKIVDLRVKINKAAAERNGDSILCTVHGSSHCMPYHYLPGHLDEIWEYQQRFAPVIYYAGKGRSITPPLVHELAATINRQAPRRQLHILMLGDNNMRNGMWSPEEVLGFYTDLLERVKDVKHCQIVLCSILPSPKQQKLKFPTFQ